MAGLTETLRSGAWLTRERIRLVALVTLATSLIGIGFLIATSDGLNDRFSRPLGTDFASFYAAGSLVRDGIAAAAFDHATHFAREQAIFGAATPYFAFQYPPIFLLVAGALAQLPYVPALALWQGATLILYLLAVRAILLIPPLNGAAIAAQSALTGGVNASVGGIARIWLLLALAFPAAFINLGHGQNGFLTVALFGYALAVLDRRPWIAGILMGLLVYKPQFGLLIPLVLLATGRWRVIAAAAATVATLVLVTQLAFGPAVWPAFFDSMTFTRTVMLEQGEVGWYKMQSVFSWVRLWDGPVALAYLVQGIVALAVTSALVWLWRSNTRYPLKAAALLIGTLVSTPFCLDYDLMLLAPAIAYLAAAGLARGFGPYEKTVLAALWIVPLIARSVPQVTFVPLAVPLMLVAFVLLVRRAMADTGTDSLWRFAARPLK